MYSCAGCAMHKGATCKTVELAHLLYNQVLLMSVFQQMAVLCFEEETLGNIHQEASKGWTRMALNSSGIRHHSPSQTRRGEQQPTFHL